ncbi:MAG: hypothetical protein DI551_09430 [Micavibrio aeruginosavorus]|uniref:Flagellar basal-body/hook protein C-terminal domain-containing protein n=1 Tax=Micavibrio aeruginosavorus TaxID=349221 RepID=A0A2W5PQK7_9BACT|nr:MAG: hypothetical protein DI551_09430 [Micavibrio aeruginosavorus]
MKSLTAQNETLLSGEVIIFDGQFVRKLRLMSQFEHDISSGDGTISEYLVSAMSGKISFAVAGNFAAQTVSISSYANSIISNAAATASTANSKSETAQLLYDQTKSTMENKTGVNIDEETANLTVLENHYQASALLISTIQDLFDSLIAAMR